MMADRTNANIGFEKQLWDVIDELKAQGRSVEDILGTLKSMGQK